MPEAITRRGSTPTAQAVMALALEENQIKGALVSETGRLLVLQNTPLKQTTVRATVAAITQLILALAASPERNETIVKAVGISVDGIIDQRAERVSFSHHNTFNWERVPLRAMIEEALDDSGVDIRVSAAASSERAAEMTSAHPLIVVHSARDTTVAAEAWCGAATGKNNVVALLLGQEISVGFLLEGTIIHGAGDLAGAASWLALSENYQDEVTGQGAFATTVSEAALVRHTLEKWTPDSDSLLSKVVLSNPAQINAATIIRAARSADPLALSVIAETCATVGRAVANLLSLLNPEAIVIGGAFGQQLKPFLKSIKAEAKRWAAPTAYKQSQIVMAKLGEQAELLGAAKLAWERANKE